MSNQKSLAEQFAELQANMENAKTPEEQAKAREALNDFLLINRKFVQFAAQQASNNVKKQQFWKYAAIGTAIGIAIGISAAVKRYRADS